METLHTDNLIAVDQFCAHHNIEISFISSLHQNGLIEVKTIHEKVFIDIDQLQELEKYIRFSCIVLTSISPF